MVPGMNHHGQYYYIITHSSIKTGFLISTRSPEFREFRSCVLAVRVSFMKSSQRMDPIVRTNAYGTAEIPNKDFRAKIPWRIQGGGLWPLY